MRNLQLIAIALAAIIAAGCTADAGHTNTSDVAIPDEIRQAVEAGEPVDAILEVATPAAPGIAVGNWSKPKIALQRRMSRTRGWRDYQALPHVKITIDSPEQLEEIVAAPEIVAVHVNVEHVRTGVPANIELIEQPVAVGRGYEGSGRAVAVLDTGIDYTHGDFGTCSTVGSDGCRVRHLEDFAPDDGVNDDNSRHGTNVAGIVAAVAPQANLVGLDVFTGDRAKTSDILAAIDWVVRHADEYGIVAINLSLGTDTRYAGSCANAFDSAFEIARAAGIVPVASSGNDADATAISAPACNEGSMAVGAVYSRSFERADFGMCADAPTSPDQVACFSNSSPQVDMLAPGVAIAAGGVRMSGTSQATPHVAGAIAVVAAAQPTWSLDEVVAHLQSAGPRLRDPRNDLLFARLDLDDGTRFPVEEPAQEEPVQDEPVQDEPVQDEPVQDEPAQDEPAQDEPVQDEPVDEDPTFERPAQGDWVFIEGHAETTDTTTVTLDIQAESGAEKMCVSNTTSCTDWQDYSEQITWELEPGAGTRTVSVWFMRSREMLEADLVIDQIELN